MGCADCGVSGAVCTVQVSYRNVRAQLNGVQNKIIPQVGCSRSHGSQFLIGLRPHDIRTDGKPFARMAVYVQTNRRAVKPRGQANSILRHSLAGQVIRTFIRAATQADLVFLHGGALEQGLLPVGSRS